MTVFYRSREKLEVAVVVDPLLSKILRPHQREVRITVQLCNSGHIFFVLGYESM